MNKLWSECYVQGLKVNPRDVRTLNKTIRLFKLLGKKDEASRVSHMLKYTKGRGPLGKGPLYFSPVT
jgi:hypothetical protein